MADVSVKIKKVPSDAETYIGVEYIESTGTQYLQLGVDTDYNTTDLYIDYQYTSVTAGSGYSQGAVYSLSYYRNYTDALWSAFSSAGYGIYTYAYGKSSSGERIYPNASTERCVLKRNSNGLFINDEQKTISQNYTPVGNSTSNITLFAMNYGENQSIMMKSKMRLYGFKLGNSQGEKYNLVPCVRKLDNVAGMYDTINKKFYTNNGTGEFVVGATNGESYYDDILVIDKHNGLKSVESLSQSTGQPKDIFYGVVPSTGNVEIIDIKGDIETMVRNGLIANSNVDVVLSANGKQVQTHISSDNEYRTTTGSKVLTMQLDNSLSNWNNINYVGYRLSNQMSLYNIVLEVLSTLYAILDIEEMIEDVKEYLQSIIVDHPYIQGGTLRDAIDKICTIAQLNVFQNDDGKIKFVSSRPTLNSDTQIISIPKRNQHQPLDADLIVKNKFGSVNVKSNKTTLEDKSLNNRTSKYFDYETLSQNFQGYDMVINDENINPNLIVLRNKVPSENNPTTTISGSFWYYYIAKYEVSYDTLDLKILRDFSPKISKQVTALFPPSSGMKTLYFADETLTPYNANYTDDEIISEWLVSTNNGIRIKSGTPNFGFKVRKNEDGSFTLFYVSLLYTTSKDVAYVGTNENIITAIYNEINIDFKAPQITQSVYSPLNNADVTIEANELLQDTTKMGGEEISTIIANNILLDYQNGIINGTMSVNCLDYYDINGNRVKNWANGEILQVGDIVRVDGDNYGNSAMKYADGSDMYFKVTGRRFRKQGVPLIDLELQEVK